MNGNEIELNNLGFSIGTFMLADLTLDIRKGEYFVLTGHNGSGKTLVIKMIAGLYRPAGGTIMIAGNLVTGIPPWKRNIGYVPQEGLLFPDRTARGNIGFPLEVRHWPAARIEENVEQMARMLAITDLLDRPVDGLSGGERQRVALARALVFGPSVLLLDEPVSAIDEKSRDELCRELRRIQQELGITVLHVAHNSREIELVADRVGQLKAGRLVEISNRTPPPGGSVIYR